MKKSSLFLFSTLLLAACAGAPVGWGGSHSVSLENPETITITYDPLLSSEQKADEIATQHCNQYGKNPVPVIERRKGLSGALPQRVYECR
ncbi:MAG: hypothetical protein KDI13_10925 [Alphaproteobacteria bacterium]|nr:hypothetical protein [Alphaproteobacteria bacterium]